MLAFRETQSHTTDYVLPHAANSAVGKKHKKRRSKKKKSTTTTPSPDSDSSDSDNDFAAPEEATINAVDVSLLGAVISNINETATAILAQSISNSLMIEKDEVLQCIEWMWDHGLRYDDEESVLKCLKEKNYVHGHEMNEESKNEEEQAVSSGMTTQEVQSVETEDTVLVSIADVASTVERLNIVATYATINLYDTLVAICSWATLFDEEKEYVTKSQVFFTSTCLEQIVGSLIRNPASWESKLEIKTAFESLLVHFVPTGTVIHQIIDSVSNFLRLLRQRSSGSSPFSEYQVVKMAKQFSETLKIIILHCCETTMPTSGAGLTHHIELLENEISKLSMHANEPKVLFQLRDMYLDLASAVNEISQTTQTHIKNHKIDGNVKHSLLKYIHESNAAIEGQIDVHQKESIKVQQQVVGQIKAERERMMKLLSKEKEDIVNHLATLHNKKTQLSHQLQLCEQEIRSDHERLNSIGNKIAEVDALFEQKSTTSLPAPKQTNVSSFHIDESTKIMDQAQRFLIDKLLLEEPLPQHGEDDHSDKLSKTRSFYIENEIKCITFLIDRLRKTNFKVKQLKKDTEVYKNLHLQKLVLEVDRQIAQAMIEMREDKVTIEQLLECLDASSKTWNKSLTEITPDGFVHMIALAQLEEISVPSAFFTLASASCRQSVLQKVQQLSAEISTTSQLGGKISEVIPAALSSKAEIRKSPVLIKKTENRKKPNGKKTVVEPAQKSVDTIDAIVAIEKSTAIKSNVTKPNAKVTPKPAQKSTVPGSKSFLDIQREQAEESIVRS